LKTKKTFYIFIVSLLLNSVSALAEFDITQNISGTSERAKQLMCQFSLCITSPVTIQVENYKNYFGYYHINENKISVRPDQTEFGMLLTLVHEYTHVYRSDYNKNEETWLSEGLAKLVEYKVSIVWPESYQRKLRFNPWLIYENSERRYGFNGDGYSDSFWLVYYLYQHFGGDQFLIKALQSKLSGWENILNVIAELQDSGAIAQNINILNRDSILRHFAMAMLLNDQFAAKYSLFYMGPDYTPLSLSGFTEPSLKDLTTGPSRQIIYSKIAANPRAREKFVVKSLNPLVIKPVHAGRTDKGLYYISIF
jgi:hypothetical protein